MRNRNFTTKYLLCGALSLILATVVCVPLAYARITKNTIDAIATVADDGESIVLTGPLKCNKTQWVDMRITVTQRSTGAVAEGHALILGTKTEQQWEIVADLVGDETFEQGEATASALATSVKPNGSGGGGVDDAHQWLVEITLVEQ